MPKINKKPRLGGSGQMSSYRKKMNMCGPKTVRPVTGGTGTPGNMSKAKSKKMKGY